MTSFLNSNEQRLITELDKFVDFCAATGFKPDKITLSHRQVNVLRRVLEKAKENPGFDYAKKLNLDLMTFRGLKLVEMGKLRPHPKRMDMIDMFGPNQ